MGARGVLGLTRSYPCALIGIVNLTKGLPTMGLLCGNKGMSSCSTSLYRRHRFPPEIIAHAVWLYHRFSLSFREVEELLAERGVIVSYEVLSSYGRESKKLRSKWEEYLSHTCCFCLRWDSKPLQSQQQGTKPPSGGRAEHAGSIT